MTPVIGVDADILLIHSDVNSGDPYGFLLAELETFKVDPIGEIIGKSVAETRTLRASDEHLWDFEQDIVHFFTIIFGNDLMNPNSSVRSLTEAEDKTNLLEILTQTFEIALVTRFGAFSGLKSEGHSSTISEYAEFSVAAVRLLTTGKNYSPIPYTIFPNCICYDEDNFASRPNIAQVYDETSSTIKGYAR